MSAKTVRLVIEDSEHDDAANDLLQACNGQDWPTCRQLIAEILRKRDDVANLRGFERGVATAGSIVRATVDNLTAAMAEKEEYRVPVAV